MSGSEIYHNFRGGTGDDGRGMTAPRSGAALVKHYENRTKSITELTDEDGGRLAGRRGRRRPAWRRARSRSSTGSPRAA